MASIKICQSAQVVATIAVVLLIFAPAASGGATQSEEVRLTRASFVRKANAVCLDYTRKINKVLSATPWTREVIRRFAALLAQQERQLARLVPPPALRVRYERMLAAGRLLPGLNLELDAAHRARDADRQQKLAARISAIADRWSSLARGLGLTECADE